MPINLGPVQLDDETVLRQLRRDMKDDWFSDPRDFEDIFSKKTVQSIIENNFSSNNGVYKPHRRSVLNVPKANFTLRYGLETGISDRVLYHGLASFLVPFYDPLLPWNVFSHRLGDKATKSRYLFRRAIPAWQDFVGVVKSSIDPGSVLLSTDLTNYFENIELSILQNLMTALIKDLRASATEKASIRSHLIMLFDCLKYWCFTETSGLPQNRDASSFLANIYMLPVDRKMIELGYKYFRYMDDIKIVCRNIYEARLALKRLSLELREIRLSINSGKTQIINFENTEEIQKSLDTGGSELRQIDSIWQTRSIKPISRTLPLLRNLTLRLLCEGKVSSREFRYCIHRLEILARCPELEVPDEYFSEITPNVVGHISEAPAVTDQLVKYLRAAPTINAQMDRISDLLIDQNKSFYTWQNYKLWLLMVQKSHVNEKLLDYAASIVLNGADDAHRSGATLYLGAMGDNDKRVLIAKSFNKTSSFLGQRVALLAMQELDYHKYIKTNVQPYLRGDLVGVYREIKNQKIYTAPPEPVSLTGIIDTKREYE